MTTTSPVVHPRPGAAEEEDGHLLGLRVLTSTFRLEGLPSSAVETLTRDWSRCLRTTADPYAKAVPVGDRLRDGSLDLGGQLAAELTREAVARLRGQALMMHACGLTDTSGRVLALVGPSGAGKSSAARVLCRDRFGYATDETVAVDESGRVIPYPKPLTLERDAETGRKAQVGPDALGLRECPSDLTLARLVVLEREEENAVEARLEQLPLDEAILALTPHTSSLTALEEPLQTLCRVIDACGGVFRLSYSDIHDAGDLLEGLLASSRPTAPSWWPEPPRTTDPDDALWALRDGKVRQRPVLDAVGVADDILLMRADRPVQLSGIGTTMWRAAAPGASLEDLHKAAVEAHGDHPQAPDLVRTAVADLCDAEVLARGLPLAAADVLAGLAGRG